MTDLFRIYIDDSGNVDANTTNEAKKRYGSITAVALKAKYLDETFNASFPKLSIKHFGSKPDGCPHNLHRRLLNTPPEHGPFSVLRDDAKRVAWNAEALRMFEKAEYTVITACVDKVAWYYRFPDWSGDFYEVLVRAALERCFYFLRYRGVGEVNIETKNQGRDQRLKEQYRRALDGAGFDHIPADKLRAVFTSREMNILTKADARPGAQLADLIAGPALQHLRHKHTGRYPITSEFTQKLCAILESSKFYREGAKGPDGYGQIWRPKTKS